MTSRPRVLILSTSSRNPFLEAWVATIRASGAATAVLVDARRTGEDAVPDVLAADTVLLTPAGPADWARRVVALLDGPPDVVFDWWGTAALGRRVVVDEWPGLPRVLCVDTYPNASRWRAELRDYAQANLLLQRAAGLVVASDAMRAAVVGTTGGRFRAVPAVRVISPFPLSAHHRGGRRQRPTAGPVRLCFTGRSDYLYSDEAGMAKDAVGPLLAGMIERGAAVDVLHPGDARAARALQDRGFGFYEETPRDAIITGGLADVIAGYDAHLVLYAQPNGTVRRRIANSLSTRFATAVCAPTPIVVPIAAGFADELFDEHPIGFRADDADRILDRVAADGADMTAEWFAEHESWSGEESGADLAALWEHVRGR